MKINARKMAVKILNKIDLEQAFSHHVLNAFFDEYTISSIDRRFISSLVMGSLENQMLLDFYIRKFSSTRFGKINKEVVNILRIGMYQIIFMDKVPVSAAVNESVKLAKHISPSLGNYVNGVLRGFVRGYEQTPLPDEKRHPQEHMSILHSHPLWLVKLWEKQYGLEFTKQLLTANNQMPPVCIRVNTLKTTPSAFGDLLSAQGIKAVPYKGIPEALIISDLNHKRIVDLDGYEDGLFQVQDISSMFIGTVANAKKGDLVIDVCAAPGGKSCHIAQTMHNEGRIVARDLYEHKCDLIQQNAKRLGINIIETEVRDALKFDSQLKKKADIVLVDAPCSGLGIIRRKPDIKYKKTEDDLTSLVKLQSEILSVASEYVKEGGTLIYSTCTLNDAENIDQVNLFLSHHKAFELIDLSDYTKEAQKTITLFPNVHQTDGFFIAKLKRVALKNE